MKPIVIYFERAVARIAIIPVMAQVEVIGLLLGQAIRR
jgi:hypothetical protein